MSGASSLPARSLNPTGFVMMDGEYWSAEAEDGPVDQGAPVIVTAIQGLKLSVKKATQEGEVDDRDPNVPAG